MSDTHPTLPYIMHEYYDQEPIKDAVDKPPHYNFGTIECIEYLKDNMTPEAFRGYLEGNTKKYMHRFRYKGKDLEDLKKAQWYLDYLIKEMEGVKLG
jgi:hypothetical protein